MLYCFWSPYLLAIINIIKKPKNMDENTQKPVEETTNTGAEQAQGTEQKTEEKKEEAPEVKNILEMDEEKEENK